MGWMWKRDWIGQKEKDLFKQPLTWRLHWKGFCQKHADEGPWRWKFWSLCQKIQKMWNTQLEDLRREDYKVCAEGPENGSCKLWQPFYSSWKRGELCNWLKYIICDNMVSVAVMMCDLTLLSISPNRTQRVHAHDLFVY